MFKGILAALLLSLSCAAQAQFYAFHQQFLGIYFTPALTGNGFSIDIQNGQLFAAIFTYGAGGDDAFLTLFAQAPPESDPYLFRGDAFLTDNSGNTTVDAGDFDLQLVTVSGQPGLVLNLESPYLDLRDEVLIRFGYGDGDALGPIAGKLWGITFTTSTGTISVLDFIGGFFLVGDDRLDLDGQTALLVTTGRDDATGVAFFDDESNQYLIGIDVGSGRDTLVFEGVSSHSDMFGSVSQFRDDALVDQRAYVGTNAATALNQTKARRPGHAPTAEDLKRFRALARRGGHIIPMPPPLRDVIP